MCTNLRSHRLHTDTHTPTHRHTYVHRRATTHLNYYSSSLLPSSEEVQKVTVHKQKIRSVPISVLTPSHSSLLIALLIVKLWERLCPFYNTVEGVIPFQHSAQIFNNHNGLTSSGLASSRSTYRTTLLLPR